VRQLRHSAQKTERESGFVTRDLIDETARQTNLLALNAAVEATRAGDAGRGFAVVASEVRNLAQRSSQAAKDIAQLITNSRSQVQEGVDLVNESGGTLTDIVQSIKQVAAIVSEIAAASNEQSTGIEQINKALAQMDEITQQNSALVEQSAWAAKMLQNQAAAMRERAELFRIEGGGAGGAPAWMMPRRTDPQRRGAERSSRPGAKGRDAP
jgi:methyl-accepting chemotaxis protein